MAKKKPDAEKLTAVRSWRFEIVGLDRETRDRWHKLQDACRELCNHWWQLWESRHIAAGNHVKIRTWMRYFAAARQAKQKPPKCPVKLMPPEKPASIYMALSHGMRTEVHKHTLVLLQKRITERLTGKDCDGRWNLWQAVLACRQGRPSCERDQPIPFDKESSSLPILVDRKYSGSTWHFDITLERDKESGVSITQTFKILAKGSGQSIIERIASGEYAFRGSQIFYDRGKGKWFAALCYRMPIEKRESSGDGVMILRPGAKTPWKIRSEGRSRFRGGYGRHITATRKRLLTSRWTAQESYKWSGSARSGHGRKRALGPIEKLRNSWRNCVTGYNKRLTTEIVRECIQRKVGTLVYCQPTERQRESRFLSWAGKIPGRRDGSLWDWYQVAAELAWKCKDAGIHLVLRKSRAARCASASGDETKGLTTSANRTARKTSHKSKGGKADREVGAQRSKESAG